MDNKTAIFIAGAIIALFAVDQLFIGADMHLFLAKKFSNFIEYLAVWR